MPPYRHSACCQYYAQWKTCCHCWVSTILIDEGVALTSRAVASAHTVAAHASALLQQTIFTPCPHAQRSELTVRRLPVHSAQ
jgi:hypothetical protein